MSQILNKIDFKYKDLLKSSTEWTFKVKPNNLKLLQQQLIYLVDNILRKIHVQNNNSKFKFMNFF